MNNGCKSRAGTLLVGVLVCLLVASTMVAATTQLALRFRREVRVTEQMRQTELLLEAGVLRAARQLQRSADYAGERWLPGAAIDRFAGAEVEIRIAADPQQDAVRRVEVIASLGSDGTQGSLASRTRRSHAFPFRVASAAPTSDAPNTESSNTESPTQQSPSAE